ncbi:CWF19-like protein 1 [Diadema antillarum]|uniref:CWF19-like protein 1 n=1 Tax=Diadema antillarum TaxID=105358 RepID=UPI003A854D28
MAEQPLKILVCGDVEGRFSQLFTRIRNVIKKAGPFEMLLCVGNFFATSESALAEWKLLQSGKMEVPISTYILGPNTSDHEIFYDDSDGCSICDNLTFLGKRGIYSTASGLQIAYLSGTESSGAGDACHFTRADIDALGLPLVSNSKFKGVDVLLTSQWPSGVTQYANNAENVKPVNPSSLIGDLALALRPRYHFSAMQNVFYERTPYRNHRILAESAKHVTRFLGLAKVGNAEKKKYLYAFNITPMNRLNQVELVKQPDEVTECPFSWTKRPRQEETENKQFFFSMGDRSKQGAHQGHKRHHHQRGGGHQRQEGQRSDGERQHKRPFKKHPQPTGPCWFCLGSPEVEKHLVGSVGTSCYVALAKGALVSDHCLILPIGHYQSSLDLPEDVQTELDQFKSALRNFYKSKGKTCVIYERNFRTQHLQLQVIPVDKSKADDIKEVFFRIAKQHKLELAEIPKHTELKQILSCGSPYFYAELNNGEKLLHRIKKFFPLQFGREVMAAEELLDMPDRINWKNCNYTKEEESKMAATFREDFQPFDFNE